MGAFEKKPKMSRRVGGFGLMIIIAMMAAAATAIMVTREREIEDWRQQMGNISLILSEQTAQTIFAAYLVLDSVTEHVRQAEVTDQASFRAKLATPKMFEMLHQQIHGLPQVEVASIIAANGDNINFSRAYPVPTINLAERDYFKAHLNNPGLGDFISQPVRNKGNGKWTFYTYPRGRAEEAGEYSSQKLANRGALLAHQMWQANGMSYGPMKVRLGIDT